MKQAIFVLLLLSLLAGAFAQDPTTTAAKWTMIMVTGTVVILYAVLVVITGFCIHLCCKKWNKNYLQHGHGGHH
jgi:hypothetical protein